MTKSEIFKTAHRMAKATAKAFGDYMIAFKQALLAIYDHLKNGRGELDRRSGSRSERFARRVRLAPVFCDSLANQYIKKNSRVVRVFQTLAELNAYEERKDTGSLGSFWADQETGGFACYEYF